MKNIKKNILLRSRYKIIFCCNILGFTLLVWHALAWPGGGLFWLDSAVFRFFNTRIVAGSAFADILAIVNNRLFDVVILAIMGLFYLYYFIKTDNAGKRRLIALGVIMVCSGVFLKLLGHHSPIQHASPTLFFEDAYRLGEHVAIKTKDSAWESFPSDHAMMFMIFAAFMERYLGRKAFLAAACLGVLFCLPRIAIGSHWVTDVCIGSLSVVSIFCSWLLLTPVSDKIASKIERYIPTTLFPIK